MFSLLWATLRWQWQGVLWTSVAALTIFVGLGLYSGDVLRDSAFELNCFLTRCVYLVIAAIARASSWRPVRAWGPVNGTTDL